MFKKTLMAGAFAAAMNMSGTAIAADGPASPFTFNVGIVSNYIFRGVSQTHGNAAIQGGVDYLHSSGFYLGAWASTITWVKDWLGKGDVEVDVYGGYKNSFGGGDWNYDVGFIAYNYPGKGDAIPGALANPNTQELYAAIGYKFVTAKYSHATSSHFIGWYGGPALDQGTRGSSYLELNANYDLGDGWTLIGHVGRQDVKGSVATGGFTSANYTDWKLGVSKDTGYGVLTLAYTDTNTTGSCPAGGPVSNAYCWGDNGRSGVAPSSGFKDVSKGTAFVSFVKSF